MCADSDYPKITLNATGYVQKDEVIALTCSLVFNGTNDLKASLEFSIDDGSQINQINEPLVSTIAPPLSEVKMTKIERSGFITVTPDSSKKEVSCRAHFETASAPKDVVRHKILPEVREPCKCQS